MIDATMLEIRIDADALTADPSRIHWLAQTLRRVDDELARGESQGESPFVAHELVQFRDYLQFQLNEAEHYTTLH